MPLRARKARLLPLIALLCIATPLLLGTSACSQSGKSKRNVISPYDPEFDPDEPDTAETSDSTLTAEEQLEMLLEALHLYESELYTGARESLSEFQRQFPSSYYAPFVELKLADAFYYSGQYKEAIEGYEEFIRIRPNHEAVPYARLQVGNSYFAQYRGVVFDQGPLSQAEKQYQTLVDTFPDSVAATQARGMLQRCLELRQLHQSYVAKFYQRQGLEDASQNRLEKLLGEASLEEAQPLLADTFTEEKLEAARASAQNRAAKALASTDKTAVDASKAPTQLSQRTLSELHLDEGESLDETIAKTTEARPLQRELKVNCHQVSDGLLLEMVLPPGMSEPELAETTDADSQVASLNLISSNDVEKSSYRLAASPQPLEECINSGLSISLEQHADAATLRVESGNSLQSARAFTLDRPRRFMLLLPK